MVLRDSRRSSRLRAPPAEKGGRMRRGGSPLVT